MTLVGLLYLILSQVIDGIFTDRQLPVLVWPPSGIALGALLMGGGRLWPGIFIGSVVVGLVSHLPAWMSLYEGVGKTLAAVLAAWMLRRKTGFNRNLTQPSDYIWLALMGGLGTCASAFTGSTALMLHNQLSPSATARLFFEWWQGDVLGILLVAPVMLVWRRLPRGWFRPGRTLMTCLCFSLAFLAGQAVFLDWFPWLLGGFAHNYWMFLFVSWAAVFYGRHGALLVTTTTAVQALYGAINNVGSFRSDIADTGLLNLWFYLFALNVVGLLLALVIHDREIAQAGLAEAKHAAEKANALRGEFLANVSHEIRTPMNAILGLSHLALRTELTPKQHDYLSKIQSSARALLNLLNDILDFSKIDAGRLEVEKIPFQLSQVLDNVSNMVGPKAEEKGLELIFQVAPGTPHSLLGDPLRVGQVLLNLVNNAVKFTDRGQVVITIHLLRQEQSRVQLEFSVRDSGIGMTKEQQERVFRAFTQADGSTSRKYGGTGLGLSISKQLVQLMGGTISVKSQPGEGSVFSFTLPLELDLNAAREGRFTPPPDLENLRVLVVDDHQTARQTLEEELRSMRFRVTTVDSGRAALAELSQATQEPYDLVLLDWKMPDIDGLETARRIKSDSHVPKVPVIFVVTGDGRDEVRTQAESLGLQAVLIKPVNPSMLFDHIVAAFGHSPEGANVQKQREPAEFSQVLLTGARVLVAEDNAINQQVVRELLERLGAEVTLCGNGQEALDRLRSGHECDVVLMDLQMPVMNGFEAAALIRSELSRTLPIIAVTAHALESERQKCLAAGMNDHVTKPIEPLDLLGTLLRWVDPARLQTLSMPRTEEEPGEAPDWPDLPGIDLGGALARLAGNRGLLRTLLGEFVETWADIVPRLQAARGEEALRLVHSFYGVTATLCMARLAQAAELLEQSLRAGEPSDPVSLQAPLQEVLDGLRELPSTAPVESSAPPADPGEVPALLAQLQTLLQDHNFEATEVFEKLRNSLGADRCGEALNRLQIDIDQLDFASAQSSLRRLREDLTQEGS